MNYFVSVIIPTYGRFDLLIKAIESVLKQRTSNIEIIVVDDGSIDNTEVDVKTYGKLVKYIRIVHSGLPAVVRNVGLCEAQGEYVAFLDDDDSWEEKKLEIQLLAMKENNCLAGCTNALRVRKGLNNSNYFPISLPMILTFRDLLKENYVICSSVIMHQSVIKKIGNFPENPSLKAIEDYSLWLRVATQTNWLFIPEPLVRYTDSPSLSIRRESDSVFEQKRRVLKNFSKWSSKNEISQSIKFLVQKALLENEIREIHSRYFSFKKNIS